MRKTRISEEAHNPKLVAVKDRIDGLNAHWPRSSLPGYGPAMVDSKDALVHHYAKLTWHERVGKR